MLLGATERLECWTNVRPFCGQETVYVGPSVKREDVAILVTEKRMLEDALGDVEIEWQFGIWPKMKCSYGNRILGKWKGDRRQCWVLFHTFHIQWKPPCDSIIH